MERKIKLITIGNWTGLAYFFDGVWYVRPQSIAQSMGFDWVPLRKKLVGRYVDDIMPVKKSSGMGQTKPVVMTLHAAVEWLAGFAGNNHMAPEKRLVAKQMAAAIARQFAEAAIEKGTDAISDDIVMLGGSHGQ